MCQKNREIFDKNFRVWRFLEQILRKTCEFKVSFVFAWKKLSQTAKIKEIFFPLNHITGLYHNQKKVYNILLAK